MRLILATCSPDAAENLLETLLRERLVGCGNLVSGVLARYWWEGELQRDDEVLMLMETTAERADAAVARLVELHPYDVPKVLTLAPTANAAYGDWLASVVASGG